jgi:predicted nucleic acid-binding protein
MRISSAWNLARQLQVYLIDTNVVSETRKKERANPGVVGFFDHLVASGEPFYLSVVSVGELRRGVELIRHRGETDQAGLLEAWLTMVLDRYGESILAFEADAAQVWGRLRVPNPGHELDKQIAAIALVHDLTVVTRNTGDFEGTGVKLINPFLPVADKA